MIETQRVLSNLQHLLLQLLSFVEIALAQIIGHQAGHAHEGVRMVISKRFGTFFQYGQLQFFSLIVFSLFLQALCKIFDDDQHVGVVVPHDMYCEL